MTPQDYKNLEHSERVLKNYKNLVQLTAADGGKAVFNRVEHMLSELMPLNPTAEENHVAALVQLEVSIRLTKMHPDYQAPRDAR